MRSLRAASHVARTKPSLDRRGPAGQIGPAGLATIAVGGAVGAD
jgi:hypothetical protein